MAKFSLYALVSAALITLAGCTCDKCPCKKKHSHKHAKVENETKSPTETKEESNSMTITRTASGLGIEVLTPGSGPKPKIGQTVTVNYTGYFDVNGQPGQIFDSSLKPGRTPFSTKIGEGYVIPGWDEGVLLMQVGEKARLYIPSKLGYGSRGAGTIPPNSDLIFDVELISVK